MKGDFDDIGSFVSDIASMLPDLAGSGTLKPIAGKVVEEVKGICFDYLLSILKGKEKGARTHPERRVSIWKALGRFTSYFPYGTSFKPAKPTDEAPLALKEFNLAELTDLFFENKRRVESDHLDIGIKNTIKSKEFDCLDKAKGHNAAYANSLDEPWEENPNLKDMFRFKHLLYSTLSIYCDYDGSGELIPLDMKLVGDDVLNVGKAAIGKKAWKRKAVDLDIALAGLSEERKNRFTSQEKEYLLLASEFVEKNRRYDENKDIQDFHSKLESVVEYYSPRVERLNNKIDDLNRSLEALAATKEGVDYGRTDAFRTVTDLYDTLKRYSKICPSSLTAFSKEVPDDDVLEIGRIITSAGRWDSRAEDLGKLIAGMSEARKATLSGFEQGYLDAASKFLEGNRSYKKNVHIQKIKKDVDGVLDFYKAGAVETSFEVFEDPEFHANFVLLTDENARPMMEAEEELPFVSDVILIEDEQKASSASRTGKKGAPLPPPVSADLMRNKIIHGASLPDTAYVNIDNLALELMSDPNIVGSYDALAAAKSDINTPSSEGESLSIESIGVEPDDIGWLKIEHEKQQAKMRRNASTSMQDPVLARDYGDTIPEEGKNILKNTPKRKMLDEIQEQMSVLEERVDILEHELPFDKLGASPEYTALKEYKEDLSIATLELEVGTELERAAEVYLDFDLQCSLNYLEAESAVELIMRSHMVDVESLMVYGRLREGYIVGNYSKDHIAEAMKLEGKIKGNLYKLCGTGFEKLIRDAHARMVETFTYEATALPPDTAEVASERARYFRWDMFIAFKRMHDSFKKEGLNSKLDYIEKHRPDSEVRLAYVAGEFADDRVNELYLEVERSVMEADKKNSTFNRAIGTLSSLFYKEKEKEGALRASPREEAKLPMHLTLPLRAHS